MERHTVIMRPEGHVRAWRGHPAQPPQNCSCVPRRFCIPPEAH